VVEPVRTAPELAVPPADPPRTSAATEAGHVIFDPIRTSAPAPASPPLVSAHGGARESAEPPAVGPTGSSAPEPPPDPTKSSPAPVGLSTAEPIGTNSPALAGQPAADQTHSRAPALAGASPTEAARGRVPEPAGLSAANHTRTSRPALADSSPADPTTTDVPAPAGPPADPAGGSALEPAGQPADPTRTSVPEPPAARPPAAVDLGSVPQLRDPARYRIIGEHGRGGLGRVTRAHDLELGRDVAIKELLSRAPLGEVRFLREALITARLEHPGIVPVHEAGRWPDGTPFYAMKLVSGRPLRDLIAERTTVDARITLLHHVIAVADAIAYAHDRNIIHRDLKPGNVIVGAFGETIVIDWGLAKDLTVAEPADIGSLPLVGGRDSDLTSAGTVLGTPAYMAPEQARGEHVDQRADVFAIGAMLWGAVLAREGAADRPRGSPSDAPQGRHRPRSLRHPRQGARPRPLAALPRRGRAGR